MSRYLLPGAKIVHIFEIPDPNLPIHCQFHGTTTKIKLCYMRKIAFSHYEGYKVYCALHAQYHVTCAKEVPQNHT